MPYGNEFEKNKMVDFWAEAWEQAGNIRSKQKQPAKDLQRTVAMWNNRAAGFAKNTTKKDSQTRVEAVLAFLDYCGVKTAGMTVLDIGCGPGNYTIPLAKRAAHVWALDPASNMLEILKERAEKEGVFNIACINRPWEEVELDKEGWLGKFDLVFASMTPGINDKETLEKMIKASKGYCYLSRFAGQRRNNLQEKLWQKLFQEAWSDLSMDIIFPFNLVYAMGYFPSLRFINAKWVNEESVEETTGKLRDWLAGYTDITPAVLESLHEFVVNESVNGLVKEEVETNIGMMVWQV